ncbi:MAG TPA: four helix bundle protein [Planctomycetota bacterium]|nr:four helix bundle protein [Planctomycetota bacterium]
MDIYKMAHEGALEVHRLSLALPYYEQREEAPQVRRSSKRISASIVEGFAQRKYKGFYLSYLYRALGSSDETQEHLMLLFKSGSFKDKELYHKLLTSYENLSGKLFRFIRAVEGTHQSPRYLKDDPSRSEEIGGLDTEDIDSERD